MLDVHLNFLTRILLPYADIFKDWSYFSLGVTSSIVFWDIAEKKFGKGISKLDPILFFIMTIWGASGFFFFEFIKFFLGLIFPDFFFSPFSARYIFFCPQFLTGIFIFIFGSKLLSRVGN